MKRGNWRLQHPGRKKKVRKCKHAAPWYIWACECCDKRHHTHNCYGRYKYRTLKHCPSKFYAWYGLDRIEEELEDWRINGYYD